jgi:hypothetical protein
MIVARLRAAIRPFMDTGAAIAAGYRKVPPFEGQLMFHFGSVDREYAEARDLNPERPSNLVYRRGSDGRLHLAGAMFIAPEESGADELDRRLPTSLAQWHRHGLLCRAAPGFGLRSLALRRDGHPLFGSDSPVASQAACDSIGGVFSAVDGPWMAHVFVFDGESQDAIWGSSHGSHADRPHPPADPDAPRAIIR